MCDNISWLISLKDKINHFLENMSLNNYSYFKYSYSGDLFNSKRKWGLGNLVFAVKILYMTKLLDEVDEVKKNNISNGILKFSGKNGYIFDPIITELTFKRKFLKFFNIMNKQNYHPINDVRRAETRQSFSALNLLNTKPKEPFVHLPYTEKEIDKFLSTFIWRDPWRAGSHFSHLLFFWNTNSKFFLYKNDESITAIKYAIDWISRIQSKDDGSWYDGNNIPLYQKINGAMKILTGLHAAEIYDFPYPKQLIDTALSGINDTEACSNFNIVYVLYSASIVEPNYRKDEVHDFLIKRINLYKEFYHPARGGFSFFKNKANDIYYGKRISRSKCEPDIHGTCLFIFGLAIISEIIDIGLDFRIPLN